MFPVFCLCLAIGTAQAQDPLDIVRRSVEHDATNAERLTNYTFVEHQEQRMYDPKGKLKSTESETSEILILSGRPYSRTIAKDNKPLSAKDAQKEQVKLDREADRRQKESAGDKSKQEKEQREQRRFLREVPDAYTFRLLGVEQVSGKPAWKIDARPKPSFKPKDSRAKLLSKVSGKIWIDQADFQWVKAEVEAIDALSFGLGLFRLAPGASIKFEQQRMNDEIWVPLTVAVRADARVAYLKKLRGEVDVTYRDYRKFSSESRIVLNDSSDATAAPAKIP